MALVIVGSIDIFGLRPGELSHDGSRPDDLVIPVVPVNCEGTMGKGIAKAAATRHPDASRCYKEYCKKGFLKPGDVIEFKEAPGVWFAATKNKWRDDSRGSWVLSCAEAIAAMTFERTPPAKVVAVPALGCGLGGLRWEDHGKAIAHALRQGWGGATFYLSPPRDT